jgi:hypothetical protein
VKKKRPSPTGKRRGSKNDEDLLVQDSDGRTFRPKSNYLSEETLSALLGTSDLLFSTPCLGFATLFEQLGLLLKAGLLDSREVREVASKFLASTTTMMKLPLTTKSGSTSLESAPTTQACCRAQIVRGDLGTATN